MFLLSPTTLIRETIPGTTQQREVQVPISVRYNRIMKILEGNSDAVLKYKEELLGSTTDIDSPDTYTLISLAKSLNLTWTEFKAIPVRDRAMMIAHHYLDSMIEVIRRHDSLQRQKMEKFQNKNKPRRK